MIEWERQDGWLARHPWIMKDDTYRMDTTDIESKQAGCLHCNAHQRNDCQNQNPERHTVLQRQMILASRGSEHWRHRPNPGQCDSSSNGVHPRGTFKLIGLSTRLRVSDRAAVWLPQGCWSSMRGNSIKRKLRQ